MAKISKTAKLVAARELPKLIDSAVKLAAQRAGLSDVPGVTVVKWDLVGRVVKERASAESFADAVAGELSKNGIEAEPAVLIVNKKIIAGFFERGTVPQMREL